MNANVPGCCPVLSTCANLLVNKVFELKEVLGSQPQGVTDLNSVPMAVCLSLFLGSMRAGLQCSHSLPLLISCMRDASLLFRLQEGIELPEHQCPHCWAELPFAGESKKSRHWEPQHGTGWQCTCRPALRHQRFAYQLCQTQSEQLAGRMQAVRAW